MRTPTPHLIRFEDPRQPKGPDGQGWNRLGISTFEPMDRCALRPATRQAALDVVRGMAHFGVVTAYAPCDGKKDCASCPRHQRLSIREPWQTSWHIREDQKGMVWLLGDKGVAGFGFFHKSWSALLGTVDVPALTRKIDEQGPFWVAAE